MLSAVHGTKVPLHCHRMFERPQTKPVPTPQKACILVLQLRSAETEPVRHPTDETSIQSATHCKSGRRLLHRCQLGTLISATDLETILPSHYLPVL